MQFEQDIIRKWRELRKYGDAKEIAQIAKCSRQTVYLAYRTGKASTHLFNIMYAYYLQRMSAYNELTEILNQQIWKK